MLIGDWECDFAQQVAKWKDGAFQDYSKPKNEKILVKFIKKMANFIWVEVKKMLSLLICKLFIINPNIQLLVGI
ncbi:hypothetical protein [uncultured Gilliamella sp.]|uniref:hypothetical protein n=1 Tax=uncultured Gilliamella sp. TaxID=1193505 RepID=UPI0025CDC08A|nr:hypothetical protein [uncultured Gilliamella sp.]